EPAEKAGIKPSDIILSVGGRPIETNSSLLSMISTMTPGTSTVIEVWRDGKLRKMSVQIAEWPGEESADAGAARPAVGSPAAPAKPSALGMSVRPLTGDERRQVDTQGSLVVEAVEGTAAEKGVQPGDIILDVAGTPVKNVAELEDAIGKSGRSVALRLQRPGQDRAVYVVIRKE